MIATERFSATGYLQQIINFYPFSATHGSGIGLINMAAMVTKLELINGEGKILTLTPQNNKDIFNAAQVYYNDECV